MRPAFQAIIEGTEYWQAGQGRPFKIQKPSYVWSGTKGAVGGAAGGYAIGHVAYPAKLGRAYGAAVGAAGGAGLGAYKTYKKHEKMRQVLDAVKKFKGKKITKKEYGALQQKELEKRVKQI